jgi:hypothetical protein
LSARTNWRNLFFRLVFELVVVFVGVYAAFALNAWQNRRQAAERRHQIVQALVREVRDITTNTRREGAVVGRFVAAMDSAFAARRSFQLVPFTEPVRVEAHMWEATLQSGGLELLDVPTIYRFSRFYNELNAGLAQLDQLRTLSETMLIPNLGKGTSEFYDDSGRLRPRYQWYPRALSNVQALAESITAMGDSIVADLGGQGLGPVDR